MTCGGSTNKTGPPSGDVGAQNSKLGNDRDRDAWLRPTRQHQRGRRAGAAVRRCVVSDCPTLISAGSRCAKHRAEQREKYRGTWSARSRAEIRAYRAQHGDLCPGWNRPPHPIAPTEWTTDHRAGPLCRACNTRKMATGDG
jgi:5-methylcytosine-specific restriction protein A